MCNHSVYCIQTFTRRTACVIAAGALLFTTGCNWFVPLAFVLPEPTRDVASEFSHLKGKVAVVVWAGSATTYNYPHVRLDSAAHASDHLMATNEDIDVVDVYDVEDFVRANASARSPEKVGAHFEADYVIYLELLNFALRDPSTPEVIHAKMYASVVVYGFKGEPGAPPQRTELSPVSLAVPERGPTRFSPGKLREVRKELYATFGASVANKFRDYEEVIK